MPVRIDELAKIEKDAFRLLEREKIVKPRVIRVDSEAILFVQEQEPWTAWTEGLADKKSILRLDRGFVADY